MPRTRVGGQQVLDGDIKVADLDEVEVSTYILGNIIIDGDPMVSNGGIDAQGQLTINVGSGGMGYRVIDNAATVEVNAKQQMSVHGKLEIKDTAKLKVQGSLVIARG